MSTQRQKTVRFTLDLPFAMHKNIKLACVEAGVTMRDCCISALEHWYSGRADESAVDQAQKNELKEQRDHLHRGEEGALGHTIKK